MMTTKTKNAPSTIHKLCSLRKLRVAVTSAFIGDGRKHVFLPVYSAYYECGRSDEDALSDSVRKGLMRGLECFALQSNPSETRFRVMAARVGKVFELDGAARDRNVLNFDYNSCVQEIWNMHPKIVRQKAAVIIQRAWNRSQSDPSMRVCRERLTREWESLGEEIHPPQQ